MVNTSGCNLGRDIFQKLCKKCAKMRLFFKKKISAKTLHNNALKGAEMRWNLVRNSLKFQRISRSSVFQHINAELVIMNFHSQI